MLKTNKDTLVVQSALGKIHHPTMGSVTKTTHLGEQVALPAVGGICYNVKIGDSVFGLSGDHIEPGVSIANPDKTENTALNFLSCIGNKAKVVSGDAKGAVGFVTGTHGGIEHVLVCFDEADMENMAPGDSILVKTCGQGLKIDGFADVKVLNIAPDLLENMNIEIENGKLVVKVAAIAPAHLMGSGIGSANAYTGDYDIMTMDQGELVANGLTDLHFGDIVMLQDCDTTFGRCFRKGAVTIGVIVHSDCVLSGHGPGVTTILTCQSDKIEAKLDKNANIRNILNNK